jgi:hypothetical protein
MKRDVWFATKRELHFGDITIETGLAPSGMRL